MSCQTMTAQLVAPVVPAGRLHLDVLADGVEAALLRLFEVKLERLIGRRGVEAVRPATLIERAELENELPVEQRPQDASDLALGDAAHAEVTRDGVDHRVALFDRYGEVVEERIVGRPQAGFGDGEFEIVARNAARLAHRLAIGGSDDLHSPNVEPNALQDDPQRAAGHVGRQVESRDMRGAHGFQPHRLPDARGAGVEDACRVVALLADGKRVGFVAVLGLHGDHLRTGPPQRRGDVRAELGVATLVMSHLSAVDPYGGDLVDGAEMQQHVAAQPARRQLENLAVPHLVVVARYARQRRLHGVGHQDLLAEGARWRRCRKGRTR